MKNVSEILTTMPVLNNQQTKRSEPTQEQKERVQAVVNKLFIQLKAACPAMFHTLNQTEESEVKRQWVIGFIENKMTPRLIDAGMMIARRQTKPFLPGVGEFIDWCKAGQREQLNIIKPHELIDLMKRFSASRGLDNHHKFNYGSDLNYWLVHELYKGVIDVDLNTKQAEQLANDLINSAVERMLKGWTPQKQVAAIEEKATYTPVSNPMAYINELKAILGRT